ncbi:putative candidate secreted effector protein [Erysiphe necator]|uniref:Putative candidate secreted effector protein n=1 Tax=Uncinula necator TaxID=52586 RepID=A0A0B1NZV5_UNCNE|nr:putative candidate secreted effector protein [Erysiphe necator]
MQLSYFLLVFIFGIYWVASSPGDTNQRGYECGDIFFSDYDVKEAVSRCIELGLEDHEFPHLYLGSLYDSTDASNYLAWPIAKGYIFNISTRHNRSTFYVILLRESKKVIGIVSRITNNRYTRCIKRGSPITESPTSISGETNGFQCADKYFSDQMISEYVRDAHKELQGKGKRISYLNAYAGTLYPKDSGYLIWPMISNKLFHNYSPDRAGPFYVLIDKNGKFVDTVVHGYGENFLRCERTRRFPQAPKSDPHSHLFVQPPKEGYQCGKMFFEKKGIQNAANVAREVATHGKSKIFPERYEGRPFKEPCLLWPILKDPNLYRKGKPGIYRVALTLDFKVISAVIRVEDQVVACEEKIKSSKKKNHDSSNYLCYDIVLTHLHLVRAAEAGCARLNTPKPYFYPARYRGPGFTREARLDGVKKYFIFPALKEGVYYKNPGKYRVVMNADCEVIGALTTDIRSKKNLIKCYRLGDGPLPDGYFSQNEPISEERIRF